MLTRVTRHGQHLTRIARFAINCYLVREDDGLTLVDCHMAGATGAILAAAEEAGVPIRRGPGLPRREVILSADRGRSRRAGRRG